METMSKSVQKEEKKAGKQRSQAEKVGRRKFIIKKLHQHEELLKRIDRRTRMLAAGLRGFLMLGEDYVSMVACKDDIDFAILNCLLKAHHVGKQTGELAAELGIDHRVVSRRIYAMNKRMEEEMEEPIITKQDGKWRLIKRLRRDFAAARGEEEVEDMRGPTKEEIENKY